MLFRRLQLVSASFQLRRSHCLHLGQSLLKEIGAAPLVGCGKVLVFLSSIGTMNALDLTHPGIVWGKLADCHD